LENTFTSLPELVDHLMPKVAYLKKFVLRNYWPTLERISQLECKVLFIAGVKDELIPHEHMLRLFAATKEGNKEMVQST
jgi:abhydrolase domain-containing protein 13